MGRGGEGGVVAGRQLILTMPMVPRDRSETIRDTSHNLQVGRTLAGCRNPRPDRTRGTSEPATPQLPLPLAGGAHGATKCPDLVFSRVQSEVRSPQPRPCLP